MLPSSKRAIWSRVSSSSSRCRSLSSTETTMREQMKTPLEKRLGRLAARLTVTLVMVTLGQSFAAPFIVYAQASAAQAKPVVTFEEVPAKTSGITWTHNNAHSVERHLPETVGAGCAFFDYDNDGWMDIYLVNSGAADFYAPATPLKNALYRNNRNGTFTDVTDKAG